MCIFSAYKYYDRTIISVNYEVFSQNITYNMNGTGSSTAAQCESVKSIFVQTVLLNIHKRQWHTDTTQRNLYDDGCSKCRIKLGDATLSASYALLTSSVSLQFTTTSFAIGKDSTPFSSPLELSFVACHDWISFCLTYLQLWSFSTMYSGAAKNEASAVRFVGRAIIILSSPPSSAIRMLFITVSWTISPTT